MRCEALDLPAAAVEDALIAALPPGPLGRLLDIGTGTGRLLELLGPRAASALGIDASRAMVALARTRLNRARLAHCAIRLMDMYRLSLADAAFDVVTLQMVLHHAEDPGAVLVEAARVLRPGGLIVIVDLAAHDRPDMVERLAHRWPGFSDADLAHLFAGAGLEAGETRVIPGPLTTTIWFARRPGVPASAGPTEVAAEVVAA